ncbi:hypothetical protein EYB53_025065 [Candidatus Chloroploca sp. M-50]|uniref:Uncharacterized protein n=1 Tax=Candidatus Chloroploca mongolica TaxID=2528176 RepID=A0ABS4DHW9_9CHLR|nr:hypothetical protein [Candidatus Chloroploca mongolica]MBP1469004.1 hypothetical protein [Candidatus Chloroploca mongolica]
MSEPAQTESYHCPKCGYWNIWTHDQIRQRGREVIYRGENEAVYTLRCQNSNGCDQRMRVAIPVKP